MHGAKSTGTPGYLTALKLAADAPKLDSLRSSKAALRELHTSKQLSPSKSAARPDRFASAAHLLLIRSVVSLAESITDFAFGKLLPFHEEARYVDTQDTSRS